MSSNKIFLIPFYVCMVYKLFALILMQVIVLISTIIHVNSQVKWWLKSSYKGFLKGTLVGGKCKYFEELSHIILICTSQFPFSNCAGALLPGERYVRQFEVRIRATVCYICHPSKFLKDTYCFMKSNLNTNAFNITIAIIYEQTRPLVTYFMCI